MEYDWWFLLSGSIDNISESMYGVINTAIRSYLYLNLPLFKQSLGKNTYPPLIKTIKEKFYVHARWKKYKNKLGYD